MEVASEEGERGMVVLLRPRFREDRMTVSNTAGG